MYMKKNVIITSLIMVVLLVATILTCIRINADKKHPVERFNEKRAVDSTEFSKTEMIEISGNEVSDEFIDETAEISEDEITEVTAVHNGDHKYYVEDIVQKMGIEFISYDVFTVQELQEQTEYAAEDFYSRELPQPDQTVKYLDREGLAEESDLLYKLFGPGSENMDQSEWLNIYEEHLEEIEAAKDRHSYEYVPEKVYFFIKVRVYNTDTSEDAVARELNLGNLRVIMSDMEDGVIISEDLSYLYNAVNSEGEAREHGYYQLEISPGEYHELIVGMCVTFSMYEMLKYEDFDTYEAYAGFVDQELIEDGVNPVLSPDMIPLSALPRGNFK